jgi:hypothetical protein
MATDQFARDGRQRLMANEPKRPEPEIMPPAPKVEPQRDAPEIPPDKDAPEKRSPIQGVK